MLPRVSVVARLYRAENDLRDFVACVRDALRLENGELEFVLVNDDSPDGSLRAALEMAAEDRCIRVVDLARTYGRDKAWMAGVAESSGDYILTTECSLGQAGATRLSETYLSMRDTAADSSCPADMPIRGLTRRFAQAVLPFRDQDVGLDEAFRSAGFAQWNERPVSGAGPFVASIREGWISALCVGCLLTAAAFATCLSSALFGAPGWVALGVVGLPLGASLSYFAIVGIYADAVAAEARSYPKAIVRAIFRGGREVARV